MLVNGSHLANQHIEIVRMFLDCEFFITELFSLVYFTYKVSFPLLNFVEISSQPDLLKVFPHLYADLVDGKMDTLRGFSVEYGHTQIPNPRSDTESLPLEKICIQAANAVLLHCGREYGFGETQELLNYTCYQLKKSNNCQPITLTVRECSQYLTERLLHLLDKNFFEKLKKANNQSIYTDKLLQTCKSWGTPVTSINKLDDILRAHGDLPEKIVRTELSYYRDKHKTEVIYNGDLFKLNKISYEDRLVNLGILLGNNNPDQNRTLPTNRAVLTILQGNSSTNDEGDDIPEFELNKIYVTLWLEDELLTWYLGYCISKNDETAIE